MKEKDIRQEVFRLAKSLGFWPITQTDTQICPKCFTRIKPPIGRPDILWLHPRQGSIVSEVKVVPLKSKSFAFKNISPEQRKWLDNWYSAGGLGFLALGTLIPRKRQLWLIPWHVWILVEHYLTPYQESIPIVAGPHIRTELQEQKLDLTHLAPKYECIKVTGGWKVPPWMIQHLCKQEKQ